VIVSHCYDCLCRVVFENQPIKLAFESLTMKHNVLGLLSSRPFLIWSCVNYISGSVLIKAARISTSGLNPDYSMVQRA